MRLLPIEILLVDNNLEQVHRMRETLRQGKILNTIHAVGDTSLALEYLARSKENETLPHCIMVDLKADDHENRIFLSELQRALNDVSIPVIILVSHEDADIVSNPQAQGPHYIARKPLDVKQLIAIVRACDNFFISLVTEKSLLHVEEQG